MKYLVTDSLGKTNTIEATEDFVKAAFSSYELITEQVESKPIRKITIGSFDKRFTDAELIKMEESTDVNIKVLNKRLDRSQFVDLDFESTVNGMTYLVAVGILTEERKALILADGSADEAYKG